MIWKENKSLHYICCCKQYPFRKRDSSFPLNITKLKEKLLNFVHFWWHITKNKIASPPEKWYFEYSNAKNVWRVGPLLLLNRDMSMKPFIEHLWLDMMVKNSKMFCYQQIHQYLKLHTCINQLKHIHLNIYLLFNLRLRRFVLFSESKHCLRRC